jgi:hypothetical protein
VPFSSAFDTVVVDAVETGADEAVTPPTGAAELAVTGALDGCSEAVCAEQTALAARKSEVISSVFIMIFGSLWMMED